MAPQSETPDAEAGSKTCDSCRQVIDEGASRCPQCGSDQDPAWLWAIKFVFLTVAVILIMLAFIAAGFGVIIVVDKWLM